MLQLGFDMRRATVGAYCPSSVPTLVVLIVLLVGSVQSVQCQNVDDYSEFDNPKLLPLFTQLVYGQISNMTTILSVEFQKRSSFCVKDLDVDWNYAFNFSFNLDFLASCIQKTKGDITWQLCTSGETKFYFNNFFVKSESSNYLRPNKNCNLTTWVSGCEPGWACSVGQSQQVNLKNSQNIPTRTHDCQACCEGFFCPCGITCMIRFEDGKPIIAELRSKGIIAIGAARFYWGGQN